jgi:hypothetical protein
VPVPKVEQIGQCLSFQWDEYQLRVTLDRFRDGGRSGASAEFQATTTAPGYQSHLTLGQLNLMAIRTRTDFARRLRSLYPEANWDEVMETVCVLGLRYLRQGEPILRLTEQAHIEPPTQRLTPLVYEGLPTVLFAPGGTGKSYLALFCAMLVQIGGWEGSFCGIPGEVLYLDFESEVSDLIDRAKRLRRGHPKLASSEPSYRRCHVPLADDLPALQRHIAEKNITFLVIDSLAAACGAELERAETAIRLFSALRSLRVASLILAHVAKNSEEKSIYGSVFFSNFARSVWEMKKVQEAGDRITRVGLYHRKSNLGPLERPIGLKLIFGEAVQMEPLDLSGEPDLAAALPAKDRIQAVLKDGLKTAKEVAEETGISLATVKARLSEGKGIWSVKVGNELWGLVHRD